MTDSNLPSAHAFKLRLRRAEKYLIQQEAHWQAVIERYGKCQLMPSQREPLEYLVRSIISQQLSSKAASTIVGRVAELLGKQGFTATNIVKQEPTDLRACGLSNAKVAYSQGIAQAQLDQSIDFMALYEMDTEAAIGKLIELKGVGRWTAQMFCIFALGHLDVFAYDDIGLQRGMQQLYQLKEKPERSAMEQISNHWMPYQSVASWYLWRIADDA